MYVYIYIYIEREIEREREGEIDREREKNTVLHPITHVCSLPENDFCRRLCCRPLLGHQVYRRRENMVGVNMVLA